MKTSLIGIGIIAAFVVTTSTADADDTAVVTGKIMLKGTPPAEKTIDMSADAACKAMHTAPVTTEQYTVNKDGTLANVFVYVKDGLAGKTFESPKSPVIMDQEGCMYHPYVFGIMVGQELIIRNSDDTLHNVHALPTANAEFNKGQPVKGMEFKHKFTEPEIMVKFKCDVHPWMFDYVGVVNNPFFDTSREAGTFKLSGLPAGTYTVEAVHMFHGKPETQDQKVTVAAGETKNADFTFEAK